MTSATASAQLDQLQLALTALRAMPHMAAQFAQNSRGGAAELWATLPPRYTAVFHNLLDRLESSALFAEESCSFSHKELLDSLQLWIDVGFRAIIHPVAAGRCSRPKRF
jgi:hypothetical protein